MVTTDDEINRLRWRGKLLRIKFFSYTNEGFYRGSKVNKQTSWEVHTSKRIFNPLHNCEWAENGLKKLKLAQIEKTIDQNETKLSFLKKDLFSFCCIFAQFLLILTEIRPKIAHY